MGRPRKHYDMGKLAADTDVPIPIPVDAVCLMCDGSFRAPSKFVRVCGMCKTTSVWRELGGRDVYVDHPPTYRRFGRPKKAD